MDTKECSKCKEVKALSEFNTRPDRPSGYRSECKRCQYERQYKRERKDRHKINAKHQARLATKKGIIQKPLFCEKCGEAKTLERHHPDYSKPLKIVWICRKCHSKLKSA